MIFNENLGFLVLKNDLTKIKLRDKKLTLEGEENDGGGRRAPARWFR
jgi:hypothetical protein